MRSDPSLEPARPGGVSVGSLSQARRAKHRFDAVLTLEDPAARTGHRLRIQPGGPAHLVLRFEDADREEYGFATATESQVETAMAFGRTHAGRSLLVHCHHGVGRSTALAIAILADRMGPGSEASAIEQVVEQRRGLVVTPNLVVIAHADRLLGRNGALERALRRSEAKRPSVARTRVDRHRLATEQPELYSKRSRDA